MQKVDMFHVGSIQLILPTLASVGHCHLKACIFADGEALAEDEFVVRDLVELAESASQF